MCFCFWLAVAPAAQTPGTVTFSILQRGVAVGSEQVTVERTPQGTTITSSGRIGPPIDIQLNTLRLRYDAEGKPLDMTVDAAVRQQSSVLQTTVSGADITINLTPAGGASVTSAETIAPTATFLPNPFVSPYEAVAFRLRTAPAGTILPLYQPGINGLTALVGPSSSQRVQTLARTIDVRQTRITLNLPGASPLEVDVWGDESGRLLRVHVPAQALEFVRDDIRSVSTRLVTMSRPNDERVLIPANGFSLAGTLSKPEVPASAQLPIVVLVNGANQTDRDETVAGIPIFGQLAHSLADSGLMVVRYDKRGIGQSGGRADVATLTDYADDAKAVVQYVRGRKDVDRRRIVLAGHGEGGWIAMLASAGNDRVTGVVLLSTAAVSGADLNLYQVGHGMERAGRPETDRQAALTLQRQIQQAVISGRGWETVSVTPQVRRQADTPYFQSFLSLDPATLIRRIEQPLLVVQGARDKALPSGNAEKLEALAKERKKGRSISVVVIPDANHLLLPATTGEPDEYSNLRDRTVSASATEGLSRWIATLPAK